MKKSLLKVTLLCAAALFVVVSCDNGSVEPSDNGSVDVENTQNTTDNENDSEKTNSENEESDSKDSENSDSDKENSDSSDSENKDSDDSKSNDANPNDAKSENSDSGDSSSGDEPVTPPAGGDDKPSDSEPEKIPDAIPAGGDNGDSGSEFKPGTFPGGDDSGDSGSGDDPVTPPAGGDDKPSDSESENVPLLPPAGGDNGDSGFVAQPGKLPGGDDSGDSGSEITPETPSVYVVNIIEEEDRKYIAIDSYNTFESLTKNTVVKDENGNTYDTYSANYQLTSDITIDSEMKEGYINGSKKTPFSGIFDGKGHTIRGLKYALFLNVDRGGVVKNLKLLDCNIDLKGNYSPFGDDYNTNGYLIGVTLQGSVYNSGADVRAFTLLCGGTNIGVYSDVLDSDDDYAWGAVGATELGCCFESLNYDDDDIDKLNANIIYSNKKRDSLYKCNWHYEKDASGKISLVEGAPSED